MYIELISEEMNFDLQYMNYNLGPDENWTSKLNNKTEVSESVL